MSRTKSLVAETKGKIISVTFLISMADELFFSTVKYDNKVMTMVVVMVVVMVVTMVVVMVLGMVRRFEWVFIASLLCGSIVAPWSAELFIPPQPHRSYICATHPYCTTSTTTNHILSALITHCAILHLPAESRVGRGW